jgi:predicted ribosome quality control (RQC) complex YloA/Tae2 family protein
MITKTIVIEDREYSILIGRNAKENHQIIRTSHLEDTWFHLNNVSSAHIILQNKGDPIPKKYLYEVASILFEYKNVIPPNVKVIYTQVKNVKCTQTPGEVRTSNIKYLKF